MLNLNPACCMCTMAGYIHCMACPAYNLTRKPVRQACTDMMSRDNPADSDDIIKIHLAVIITVPSAVSWSVVT